MDQFKKGGKLQNSNLYATNRLFVKNPLFKKRKKKAPGVYNPNAKFKFPDGGIVQLDGYRYKKSSNGWTFESGAPVTDPIVLQKLNYGEGKPIGSSVVQGLPKVQPVVPMTSKQRIEKINTLKNSPKLSDQAEAQRLDQEQRGEDIFNPQVTPEEKINPNFPGTLPTLEWQMNKALGFPMAKAHTAAAALSSDPGEETDNFRHPTAGRYVAEGIANLTGNIPYISPALGFIGSNALGIGHEFMTLTGDQSDDSRPFLDKLTEAGEDIYNNYVGAKVGASDMTPEEKTRYLIYLSENNKLPDGVVISGKPKKGFSNNLYFKDGPNDPGKYKSSYAVGGAASPKDLDPEHMKKYLEALRFQENDAKKGYKNGKWYPHHSVEGGADTIAYGHKLTPNDAYLRKGITEDQAISLQEQDVLKNQALAKKQVDKKYGAGTFDSLPQDSQMLLVDYQYNLGTLSGFPSFVKATVEGDKEKMLAEHKRYGAGMPLKKRNEWTASVINNMQIPEPFDPNQITIPLANIPDNTNVVNPVPIEPLPEVQLPPNAKGGIIELELDQADIDHYVKGGYVVEDISVPSLNKFPDGGTLYTYPGNPNASYKKIGDQWYISNKSTGNNFVPIQDPGGKRAAELNKNAVVLPGQPAPVEQPRGVQGNVPAPKLPGQAKLELSAAKKGPPTVQNQEKVKTLEGEVKKEQYQAAELARKKQIEKEKEEQALLLAQSNPSDNPNGINNDLILDQPSAIGYKFDQDKERYQRDLLINQAINSGAAGALLGDRYLNQNSSNPLSLREMVSKGFSSPDADKFAAALQDAKYEEFLKQEQKAYDNMSLLDKTMNEGANFLADWVYTGGQWLGGNRTLVGQGTGVRDESNPNYQYYNRATGIQDDWANKVGNFFSPGASGASARVHWNNGEVIPFGMDMLGLGLKAKIGTQGLKATSEELGNVLKKNILGTGVTGNQLLKGYSAYEGATKYAPRAAGDILNYLETGKKDDLLDALYSTGKVAAAYIPFTKYNDANLYPMLNEAKSLFSVTDSGVKGVGDAGATDYQFKTVEKANKLAKQLGQAKEVAANKLDALRKPLTLATMLRFAKPQKTGGSVESELTEQEIQDLIAQGYVIEQL